jgi:integrase
MASIRKRLWKRDGETRSAWIVDWSDASGARHRRQFHTKRDADAFRVEIENQLRKGLFRVDAYKMTVGDLAARYIEYIRGRRRRGEGMTEGTLRGNEAIIRNYILSDKLKPVPRTHLNAAIPFDGGIGHVKLAHLTSGTIAMFRDCLRDAGKNVIGTRNTLSALHTMLEYAMTQDLIATNPAKSIRVIGRRDEGSRKVVAPPKETIRLVLSMADQDFRVTILFAVRTGVRAGELHAMRWRNLNLEKGELRISTRVDAWGNEDGQGTKTAAGNRPIPLSQTLVAELEAWRLRTPFSGDDDLVFPNTKGSYWNHNSMMSRKWRPLVKKLLDAYARDQNVMSEQPVYTNWHSLRHFAISTWIEAGFSPKEIQTFAGHKSLQVTMDRYGHMFPSKGHREAMDKIARDLG